MRERDKPHLIIPTPGRATPYQPPNRAVTAPAASVPDDRRQHGRQLRDNLQQADAEAAERRQANPVSVESAIEGIYATFESFPGIHLALESLDPRGGKTHPELMSVQEVNLVVR